MESTARRTLSAEVHQAASRASFRRHAVNSKSVPNESSSPVWPHRCFGNPDNDCRKQKEPKHIRASSSLTTSTSFACAPPRLQPSAPKSARMQVPSPSPVRAALLSPSVRRCSPTRKPVRCRRQSRRTGLAPRGAHSSFPMPSQSRCSCFCWLARDRCRARRRVR